jgi:hypothetical protein
MDVMNRIDERVEPKRDVNLWVIAAGALAGVLAGYVLTTPRGRRAFDEAIGILDDFAASCARFSQACARAQVAASDGWHAVTDVITPKSMRTR